jgi:hypothetical protein
MEAPVRCPLMYLIVQVMQLFFARLLCLHAIVRSYSQLGTRDSFFFAARSRRLFAIFAVKRFQDFEFPVSSFALQGCAVWELLS